MDFDCYKDRLALLKSGNNIEVAPGTYRDRLSEFGDTDKPIIPIATEGTEPHFDFLSLTIRGGVSYRREPKSLLPPPPPPLFHTLYPKDVGKYQGLVKRLYVRGPKEIPEVLEG